MGRSLIEIAVERTAAQGDRKIQEFSGSTRGVIIPWETGDVIIFPDVYDIRRTKIEGREAEYCFVEVKCASGETAVKQFFPSMFHRAFRPAVATVMEDGIQRGVYDPDKARVVAGGEVISKIYYATGSVNEVMNQLKGKQVKVTVHEVPTLRFGTDELIVQKVCDFDPDGWTIE